MKQICLDMLVARSILVSVCMAAAESSTST